MCCRTLSCRSSQLAAAHSGEHLDPATVLAALSEETPLAEAHMVLAALLAERQHHARQGGVVRALRKSAHLAAAATRAEVHPDPPPAYCPEHASSRLM
jgi:Vacuolar sorting protein 39 domain 2